MDTAHSVQVCYIKEKTRHKRCNKRKEGKEMKHTGKKRRQRFRDILLASVAVEHDTLGSGLLYQR